MSRTFRFTDTWHLTAAPEAVFEALADVEHYPNWWPQIRRVERHTDDVGAAYVRSMLPYTLRMVISREVQDAPSGTLRVGLAGDLTGFAAFDVRAVDGGSTAAFREEVDVTARWLRRVSALLGPALRTNHEVMMRAGEKGLQGLLSHQS